MGSYLGKVHLAKVLIVDDDPELILAVQCFLSPKGFLVESAADGMSALDFLSVSKYDAIILDLGLPDMDGLTICHKLRNAGDSTPIIMLTGKAAISDKELGFNTGADDYLTKPFSLKELLARLQAIMRRPAVFLSNVLRCGDLELNTENRTLTRAGQEISLSPIELSLLELFMKHPQQFFSTDTLLARVWPSDKDSTDEAVRASIKRLRRKIDGANIDESESLIESNRRVGYRFRRRLD